MARYNRAEMIRRLEGGLSIVKEDHDVFLENSSGYPCGCALAVALGGQVVATDRLDAFCDDIREELDQIQFLANALEIPRTVAAQLDYYHRVERKTVREIIEMIRRKEI